MSWDDDADFDLLDTIDECVREGFFDKDSAAYGIAQQAAHQGVDSLSGKQRFIFDEEVAPALDEIAERDRMIEIINSNPV